MIKLRSINKQYDRSILTNVNLDFVENKIYVIKGVSGCGKTTLLNILGGLDATYTGTLEYGNTEIIRTDEKKISSKQKKAVNSYRSHVGYIFQQSLLISHLNVKENLIFIHDDEASIIKYADLLGVSHLLNKYPNELSNGERQRISIIRALILNCSIILADEPTASLDEKTSMEVVKAFLKIKDENKIIIIVTHEDCFDGVADYVWRLDYGTIEEVHSEEVTRAISTPPAKKKISHYKQDARYAKMKRKHSSKVFNFSLFSITLIVIAFIGFYLHLEEGLSEYVYDKYPYQTMVLDTQQAESIQESTDQLKRYENYYVQSDGYTILPWLEKQDSALSIPDALLYGAFPSNSDEIVITKTIAEKMFPDMDLAEVIHKEVVFTIDENPYKIAAILTDDKSIINMVETSYPTYQGLSTDQVVVFMSYDKVLEYGTPLRTSANLFSLDKAAITDPQFQNIITKYSPWKNLIRAKIYGIETTMDIFILCVPVILFLAFMFLLNMIYMDVLYRKSEFGYLQIFHIDKRRIYFMVFLEYLYRIITPVVLAFVVYIGLNYFMIQVMQMQIALKPLELILAALFILLYVSLLVYYPMRKILKQSILQMIHK